jgi:hypothetical protein
MMSQKAKYALAAAIIVGIAAVIWWLNYCD